MSIKYIGMDVHQATIVIVLNPPPKQAVEQFGVIFFRNVSLFSWDEASAARQPLSWFRLIFDRVGWSHGSPVR